MQLLKKNWILAAILLLGSFLRFYDYPNRWALAYDQAWFAVIARHALHTFQLPLLGPFASGGPFQTGGEWFWIVMLGIIPLPQFIITPWVFITLLSVVQIYLLYVLGKAYKDRTTGLVLAFLGAISPSLVLQSTNLTSQMTVSILATVFLLFAIIYIKSKKLSALFYAALSIGFAFAIHFQGIMLIPSIAILIVLTKSFHWKKLVFVFLGLFIPWIPVFLVDATNHFYNTISILTYYTNPQSQASYDVLGRRWLTYILEFIPSSWGYLIGGNKWVGYIEILLVGAIVVRDFIRKKITLQLWFMLLTIAFLTVVLRYLRVPLYANYINFLHPFILLLITSCIIAIWRLNKLVAMLIMGIVIVFTFQELYKNIVISTNYTAESTTEWVKVLKQKYPGESFDIYDYNLKNGHRSMPLVYFLQTEGLTDNNGRRIGIAIATEGAEFEIPYHKVVTGDDTSYQLLDLSASSSVKLRQSNWKPMNPQYIYDSVENWFKHTANE